VITALYPVPVETLLALGRTVSDAAERYRGLSRGTHRELLRERPEKFEHFDTALLEVDRLPQVILRRDTVGSFVEHGAKALAWITYLAEAMALVQERFRRRESMHDYAQVAFGSVDVSAYLKSLEADLSSMTPVHRRVQLHLTAASAEYVFSSPALMLEHRPELDAFYEPVVSARDRFFETPSSEALERYVTEVGNLAEREHPMERLSAHEKSAVRRRYKNVERAEDLLTELVSDELSLRLLEV